MAKRLLDILISLPALLAFMPLGLIIAFVLRFAGEGKVFFIQQRIGRDFLPFSILKFCTMLSGKAEGSLLAVRNDPRVFPIGRVLRATKLNEVPQLLNVLVGQMAIVGPRPMLKRELAYVSPELNARILSVPPGLTGIGSIVFRDEERLMTESAKGADLCYQQDIAPLKADLEAWYVDHQSLTLDLWLIFYTAWQILFPESRAYLWTLGKDQNRFEQRINALFDDSSITAAGEKERV